MRYTHEKKSKVNKWHQDRFLLIGKVPTLPSSRLPLLDRINAHPIEFFIVRQWWCPASPINSIAYVVTPFLLTTDWPVAQPPPPNTSPSLPARRKLSLKALINPQTDGGSLRVMQHADPRDDTFWHRPSNVGRERESSSLHVTISLPLYYTMSACR